MLKLLKKIFIPGKHNDYKPHFLREHYVVSIFFGIFMLFGLFITQSYFLSRIDLVATVLPSVLIDLANSDRKPLGLGELHKSDILVSAAKLKAQDMATKSYFSHYSPDGKSPWYWFRQAGYNFVYAGENLAMDFSDSVDVNQAWLNSPTHRANILNLNFTEIGIATAEGYYNGKPTTFVVQLFGQPVPAFDQASVISNNQTKPTVAPVRTNKTNTPANVLASETESDLGLKVVEKNDTFLAVQNTSTQSKATTTATAEKVAGTETYSSWFEKLLVSPRKTLAIIYIALGLLIALTLVLLVGMEIGRHHKKHIIYGVILLLLILIMLYFSRVIIIKEVSVL